MLENNCLDRNSKWIFLFIKMANGIRTQNFRMPAERTTNSATDPHGRAQPK